MLKQDVQKERADWPQTTMHVFSVDYDFVKGTLIGPASVPDKLHYILGKYADFSRAVQLQNEKQATMAEEAARQAYFKAVSDMMEQTLQALKEIKAAAQRKSVIDVFQESQFVKRILDLAPRPSPVSGELQILLEEIRQRHEIEMKRMEMEIATLHFSNDCHLFEMREARDERIKRAQFRTSTAEGITELLVAVVESLKPVPKKRRFLFFWR